mmetsp:Transcript_53671/g.151183  ORF Transcript_53671/g.151183 Transcript_53671/m.151183 type:complete len:247 (+) Transcript_53671:295-1035(+)
MQKLEHVQKVLDYEIRRSEGVHGKDSRTECDVLIGNLGNLGAHTVQGKDDVRHFDEHDDDEKHGQLPASLLVIHDHRRARRVVAVPEAAAAEELQGLHRPHVPDFGAVVVAGAPDGEDAAVDEQAPDRPAHPAEGVQQRPHDEVEAETEEERAEDADEDRLPRLFQRRLEGPEDEVEHEEVVHREQPLQHVAVYPRQSLPAPQGALDPHGVAHPEHDPGGDDEEMNLESLRKLAKDRDVKHEQAHT